MIQIFVTGATGYIGGRLVPALLREGYSVKCLARSPRKLSSRPWFTDRCAQIVEGDVADTDALADHMRGCSVAYYLVHSMVAAGDSYAQRDRELAESFREAAERAGVKRIIYLGGLGELGDNLSAHLRSRRDVGEILRDGKVPVTTLRAAMIIGSGSASFEILRYLVNRLPAMITPRWVNTECQPIAVRDVLAYLVGALKAEETSGRILEIGGQDVLRYLDLMRIMAEELELPRRLVIPVPVLTPRLSSLWIGLVTPVTPRIARPLAEGLRNRVVVTGDNAKEWIDHEPMTAREAIRRALGRVDANEVETRWSAAGVIPGDPDWAGGQVFRDDRSIEIAAPADSVFAAVCRVGGGHGWYAADWLWRIRGWMDQIAGGPGLRRGRRDPERVEFGEALDFWRVTGVEENRSLMLRAEMKLPGIATLGFEIEPDSFYEGARSTLRMNARFRPKGLLGIAYWYAVLPFHHFVFSGMLSGIRRRAESLAVADAKDPESRSVTTGL
jgi:uncharacterized protein YbjT (DUF2867 family)